MSLPSRETVLATCGVVATVGVAFCAVAEVAFVAYRVGESCGRMRADFADLHRAHVVYAKCAGEIAKIVASAATLSEPAS